MGLFKGMKDISKLTKQAKEVQHQQQKEAGYKPGLSGMFSQMSDQVGQATEMLADMSGQSGERERIMAEGIDAMGTIIGMGTPARGAQTFNLDIDFEVHIPGRPSYRVANQYMVKAAVPIGVGVTLPLKVDPNDLSKIAIVWEQAPQAPARGEVRPAAPSTLPDPPAAPPPPSSGGRDSLADLERLAALYASGALTAAEYEQLKKSMLAR